jgi:glycosyltransferase involved in cell wall biosynthesis
VDAIDYSETTFQMKNTSSLTHKPLNLLAVDLEPAPYKVDLWNAFASSEDWQVEVLYTNAKDVSKDAGHNYQELPSSHFAYQVLHGNSLLATISKIVKTVRAILDKKVEVVFISGYVNAAPLAAILTCVVSQKPFFVHSDIFNIQAPRVPLAWLKRWVRDGIRAIIFRFSAGVLVCGKLGYESSLLAGCPQSKVIDFPYVVDRDRLLADEPTSIPLDVQENVNVSSLSLYFSGRMIERKGLATLLEAAAQLDVIGVQDVQDWIIWIAGDGPLLKHYQQLAQSLGISHRVRFLGFVQMKLHSWLLRNASIVVVPSFADAWGIVVDEGMQLGKPVIASSGVGSAVDRIESGNNGLLFAPGDISQLKNHLVRLLSSDDLRFSMGMNSLATSGSYGPKRNVSNLQQIFGRPAKVSHED